MTELEGSLRQVLSDLVDEGLRFALVGGLAVSARAEPRLTRDCDFAVWVDGDPMAEQVVAQLAGRGYRAGAVVEQRATGRLAAVRLGGPDPEGAIVDLLFASCGIEQEIVTEAEMVEILPGLVVPLARTGHLIAMKLLARDDRRRPADHDDLRSLASIATDADWEMAGSAVALIEQRGYGRDRDLGGALVSLRAGWADW